MADSSRDDRPDASADRPGVLMGRPFGIPVYVSPTWFFIAALITWGYAPIVGYRLPEIGAMKYAVAFAFAVLLYVSVLVHELSHSIVARAYDLPVRRITLYMLGGVSEIEEEPQTPGREFLIAFAGPLLSLVLAGVGWVAYQLLPPASIAGVLVFELTIANFLVGVFNLLPGLPLDGGRMLRAGVWRLTHRPSTATIAAAWAGRGLAVLVVLVPFVAAAVQGTQPSWFTVIWAGFIAAFIWLGATQSIRVARIRDRLPNLHARGLARRALPVTADVPVSEAVRRAADVHAGAIVVVDYSGRPMALVSESAVSATPEQRRPWIQIGTLARTIEPGMTLTADLSGRDLLDAMRTHPAGEYLLVDTNGDVYGVLVASDVDRAFAGV
ncbi:MAG TPA: site-2 protease family protein [Streptosporangiaceae bacterium]